MGTLSAGNVVELGTTLPSTSSWFAMVTVVNASGVAVTDEDGDPSDGHFRGTIPTDGTYYAKMRVGVWAYNGHTLAADGFGDDLDAGGDVCPGVGRASGDGQRRGGERVAAGRRSAARSATCGSGLTDQAVEGTWVWSSGQAVTYTNWASGQPNDYDDYGWADADDGWCQTDGKWYDLRLDNVASRV